MGQFLSLCCIVVCPHHILKEDNLLYKGNNSAVYELKYPTNVIICKVVRNRTMFAREYQFIQEMKKYSSSQHANIIRYYRFIPCCNIFLMEHADEDLLGWLKRNHNKPFYISHLYKWLEQLAHGYRFLYRHHIEHYDIKPDNLLIVGNVLKIADFGTCHIDKGEYALYTGTRGFIAPEIVELTNKDYYVPHSMDVYSICIMILYLQYAPLFQKFYYKEWTLNQYLYLEQYTKTQYSYSFLKGGVIVDQRYRVKIADLLDYLETIAGGKIYSGLQSTGSTMKRVSS